MSLVPVGLESLSVILWDEDKRALVLYDRDTQALSMVGREALEGLRRGPLDPTSPGSDSSRIRCSACGQYINGGFGESIDESFGESMDESFGRGFATGSRSRPLHRSSHTSRDPNYFKLLESRVRRHQLESPQDSNISSRAFCQGYFSTFFRVKSELGRGARGLVFLVEHVLDGVSLGLFAVKKVPVGHDHAWLEKVLAEVHLLRVLSHPNLVSYNHVWLETATMSQFGPEVPCAFILQEYCDQGSLEEYVLNKGSRPPLSKRERLGLHQVQPRPATPLTVTEILSFISDIAAGVAKLHDKKIIHRDLKPSNCLLARDAAGQYPRVLVSDFGEGQIEGNLRTGSGSTGTLEYCAPELVNADADGSLAQFCKDTDMFSVGMILHFLCFARLPYSQTNNVAELQAEVCGYTGFAASGDLDRSDLPSSLVSLLHLLLSPDPDKRPSAVEVLSIVGQIDPYGPPPVARRLSIEEATDSRGMENMWSRLNTSSMLLLTLKMSLLVLKTAMIVYRPPSGTTNLLILACGVELLTTDLRLVLGLFCVHCVVCLF